MDATYEGKIIGGTRIHPIEEEMFWRRNDNYDNFRGGMFFNSTMMESYWGGSGENEGFIGCF